MVVRNGMDVFSREEAFPKTRMAQSFTGITPLGYFAYVANESGGNNHYELMKELIDFGQL